MKIGLSMMITALVAVVGWGQTATGTFVGVVVDERGAVVQGATNEGRSLSLPVVRLRRALSLRTL